jgi:hypothetical protein
VGLTEAPELKMQATFQADLEKAKEVTENAKGAMTAAANKMFVFYAKLLSVKAKYGMHGTRLLKSRQKTSCMLIFKGSCRKAQGECHITYLMIA